MNVKPKTICILWWCAMLFSGCSSSIPASNVETIISEKQIDTTLKVNVTEWLQNGTSDPFNASIALDYDPAGAYAGTMTFNPASAQGKVFDSTFYDKFIACLANDLAIAHHAKSWAYYGFHAEKTPNPNEERGFFIIFRNNQTLESIKKRYMLPIIDERIFEQVDNPLFAGSYCANYKSNLSH